jgi:hypothetical protein
MPAEDRGMSSFCTVPFSVDQPQALSNPKICAESDSEAQPQTVWRLKAVENARLANVGAW